MRTGKYMQRGKLFPDSATHHPGYKEPAGACSKPVTDPPDNPVADAAVAADASSSFVAITVRKISPAFRLADASAENGVEMIFVSARSVPCQPITHSGNRQSSSSAASTGRRSSGTTSAAWILAEKYSPDRKTHKHPAGVMCSWCLLHYV